MGRPCKPGQSTWGSGSTPTFFGPNTGGEYLTLIDNADNQLHVLVVKTSSGEALCSTPVFAPGAAGSGSSPIGAGRTVIVTNTFGYPAAPDNNWAAVAASAPFVGGMTRLDVRPDESGCDIKWNNTIHSAAQPRLSTGDGTITTMTRNQDRFSYTAVDAATGAVLTEQLLGATTAFDPMQNMGSVAAGGVIYQGTFSGIQRIAAL